MENLPILLLAIATLKGNAMVTTYSMKVVATTKSTTCVAAVVGGNVFKNTLLVLNFYNSLVFLFVLLHDIEQGHPNPSTGAGSGIQMNPSAW